MSQPDPSSVPPAREPVDAAAAAPPPAPQHTPISETEPDVERGPIVEETERVVTLERSVRVGRLLIGGIIAGAFLAMLASLMFPVAEDAEYTLGQIVGFMALIGAAVGAALGGLLALLLGFIARRQSGTGVAIQSDVR